MHQGRVALAAHGLDHAERRERIDEGRGAIGRGGAGRQRQARVDRDTAVLRVHRAAERGDGLAEQGLRRVGFARFDHDPGAFVAHRHGRAEAGRHAAQHGIRNARRHHGRLTRAAVGGGGQVGAGEQQTEIRRIDRRRLDADQHFVGRGSRDGHARQRYFQLAGALDQGTQLQRCAGVGVLHILPSGLVFSPAPAGNSCSRSAFRRSSNASTRSIM